MTRSEILAAQIGQPWAWRELNCWDFAAYIECELFGRILPIVTVPGDLSKRWVLEAIESHPERGLWSAVVMGPEGIVSAGDGALVLMAHTRMPAHIGVWLKQEQRVIHCSEQHGVCLETVLALKQMGWRKMTFYEPKEST